MCSSCSPNPAARQFQVATTHEQGPEGEETAAPVRTPENGEALLVRDETNHHKTGKGTTPPRVWIVHWKVAPQLATEHQQTPASK